MRKSIRRRTRKRSIHKKHNKKSRISKKNRNNKRYIGGGCGAPSMMLSSDVSKRWWRQNNLPLSPNPTSEDNRYYSWTKYDCEMVEWLNENHAAFERNNPPGRRPQHLRSLVALKKDQGLVFDFENLLEIHLKYGTAKKILTTNSDALPYPYLMPLANSEEANNLKKYIDAAKMGFDAAKMGYESQGRRASVHPLFTEQSVDPDNEWTKIDNTGWGDPWWMNKQGDKRRSDPATVDPYDPKMMEWKQFTTSSGRKFWQNKYEDIRWSDPTKKK